MPSSSLRATALSVLAVFGLVLPVPAQSVAPRVLVAVNHDGSEGSIAEVGLSAPWPVTQEAIKAGPNTIVRQFGNRLFTIDRARRSIDEFAAADLRHIATYHAGATVLPMDLVLLNSRTAMVSDYDGTHALWLDTLTGQFREGPDLGAYADGDTVPDMAMMERVGNRVYLQLQRYDRIRDIDCGALLAVFERVSINPASREPFRLAGVIALAGRRPTFKMQASVDGVRLWLSAPGGVNDGGDDTGIEEVDLVAGRSTGFVIREGDGFGGDVGPFAMVSDDKGFAVVHTSIGASTHLRVFDRNRQIAELHSSLLDWVDCLAFDDVTRQVFYPVPEGGGSSSRRAGSILVFDADRDHQLSQLLPVGGEPHDITVVR